MSSAPESSVEQAEWWRAVLAEYPTGISLVTSRGSDGQPKGMIVGSFVAISQNPPLIGYFGDDSSTSFHALADSDRFAVSVLGDAHDGLLRAFIRKDDDRFTRPELIETASGLLRVGQPVAWFEARTERVERYGDHQLVVGQVEGFGAGGDDAGSPLLYRRGGFGSFAVPSDAIDARLVGARLAAAQQATEVLKSVADELDRDIVVTTQVGESVIVLVVVPPSSSPEARDASPRRPDLERGAIGMSLPFAAPVEPVFAAWAPDRVRSLWIERARHLVGAVDRRSVEAQLAAIRERGYGISVDKELTLRFFVLITDPRVAQESYAKLWSEYAARTIESIGPDLPLADIAAIQVPVFDANGDVALVLTASEPASFSSVEELDRFAGRLLAAAQEVGALVGPRLLS